MSTCGHSGKRLKRQEEKKFVNLWVRFWEARVHSPEMRFHALAIALLFVQSGTGTAAEFNVIPTGTPISLIFVAGEIIAGDDEGFKSAVASVGRGLVVFESPGGSLIAGLEIGREIRRRGFDTGVAPEEVCASACALAWLGGQQRYMDPFALVGFHAAYEGEGDTVRESGVANALVGAYFIELGFSTDAIVFATSAHPEEMSWLTLANAREFGIPVTLLTMGGVTVDSHPSDVRDVPLRLPKGFRWIVLASRAVVETSDVQRYGALFGSGNVSKVLAQNGFQAIIAGPFDTDTAQRRLRSFVGTGRFLRIPT